MPKQVSWRSFMKKRMGPYMKKYGGHGSAMRHLSEEWKTKQTKNKKKPKR